MKKTRLQKDEHKNNTLLIKDFLTSQQKKKQANVEQTDLVTKLVTDHLLKTEASNASQKRKQLASSYDENTFKKHRLDYVRELRQRVLPNTKVIITFSSYTMRMY